MGSPGAILVINMLTTNILPAREKKEIRLEESRRVVIFLAGFLVVNFIVASLLLFPSYLPLVVERRGLEDSLRLEEAATLDLGVKEKIASMQRVVSVVNAVGSYAAQSSRPWALLQSFLENSGQGISISFLSINKNAEFTLIGSAATRRDLLGFEERLREGKKIEDLSSPLSNIVRETNISFSLQGKLKSMFRF